MASPPTFRRWWWKRLRTRNVAAQPTRAARNASSGRQVDDGVWDLGPLARRLRHTQLAALQIQRHAIRAQELVPDNAAHLEAKQHAWRLQVEHHHREVVVVDLVEFQVH